MNLTEITEGNTKLLIPKHRELSKRDVVFFNPEMQLSRDISVIIANTVKAEKFCDVLAGTGARGIRIANESKIKEIVINDKNPRAYELISMNRKLNDVDVRIENLDANVLLSKERFDFIDIDPFGTPVRFIDSALRSIMNNGILSITATDTSALCGTHPRACIRKYDSIPLRTDYYNELGLRILIAYIGRSALRYNIAVVPIFSHCTRHYFRAYLIAKRSRRLANNTIEKIKFIAHCFNCLKRKYISLNEIDDLYCECGHRFRIAGRLWADTLADKKFCGDMLKTLRTLNSLGEINFSLGLEKLIGLIGSEQDVVKPYYDIHKIFKRLKMPSLSMSKIEEMLSENNITLRRTHFSNIGIRTDADVEDLYAILG